MNRQNRRAFLQTSAATALTTPFGRRFAAKKDTVVAGNPAIESLSPAQSAPRVAANEGKKPLRLGLIIGIGKDPDAAMAKDRDLGLPTSQVFVDEFDMDLVGRLRQALEKHQRGGLNLVLLGPVREAPE